MLAAIDILEATFLGILVLMTAASGWIALIVVVRIVEPKGFRAMRARLAGKTPSPFRVLR